MNSLTTYIDEIKQLLNFENYTLVVKRIIDLTLDTHDCDQYKKTVILFERLDTINPDDKKAITDILGARLAELAEKLEKLSIDLTGKVLISLNGLVKNYNNSAFKLGPISLELKEREIVGLVGENGNGKTTLLRTLCRELKPTGGNITYNFKFDDGYDLRSKLVYIPQRTKAWKGSLLSNLQFTAAQYGIKGSENDLMTELAIARMGLRKYRNYSWKNLSSGYKMRFELARVLLQKPKILLIDEPLANLDIMAQQTVLDDFRDIARSLFHPMGIILSSQQLYEVEKTSDEVVFLKEGQQRNLVNNKPEEWNKPSLIIEFESEWEQDQLYAILKQLNLDKLYKNGGTYVASFPDSATQVDFLQVMIENNIPMMYFRNISNSTRRFFLS